MFRRRRGREIREEIETHLEMATRERIERGESPDQAREAACREFGNVDLVQRNTREVWSWTKLEQLVQDASLRRADSVALTGTQRDVPSSSSRWSWAATRRSIPSFTTS